MQLNAIYILAGVTIAANILGYLMRYGRPKEIDRNGNPVLRYLISPYIMILCGLFMISVGVYQWFIPSNHHYSGNLLILSYTPIFLGIFTLCFAVWWFKYKVVLVNGVIVVHRWPFACVRYEVAQLEEVESIQKHNNAVLHFSGNKKFTIYSLYSGKSYFLSQLNSMKTPQSFPR